MKKMLEFLKVVNLRIHSHGALTREGCIHNIFPGDVELNRLLSDFVDQAQRNFFL